MPAITQQTIRLVLPSLYFHNMEELDNFVKEHFPTFKMREIGQQYKIGDTDYIAKVQKARETIVWE